MVLVLTLRERLRQAIALRSLLLLIRLLIVIIFLSCLRSEQVAGNFLALFQDLIDHFATEFLHMGVLKLLNIVTAHYISAYLLISLTRHDRGLLRVMFLSNIQIALILRLERFLQIRTLLKRELAQRAY